VIPVSDEKGFRLARDLRIRHLTADDDVLPSAQLGGPEPDPTAVAIRKHALQGHGLEVFFSRGLEANRPEPRSDVGGGHIPATASRGTTLQEVVGEERHVGSKLVGLGLLVGAGGSSRKADRDGQEPKPREPSSVCAVNHELSLLALQ
jgi:hypothetical protein